MSENTDIQEQKNTYRLVISNGTGCKIVDSPDVDEIIHNARVQWLNIDPDSKKEIIQKGRFEVVNVDTQGSIWDFVIMYKMQHIRSKFFTDLYSIPDLEYLKSCWMESHYPCVEDAQKYLTEYVGKEHSIVLYLEYGLDQSVAEKTMTAIACFNALNAKKVIA